MTIFDALEKAKRLAQERGEGAEPPRRRQAESGAPVRAPVLASAPRRAAPAAPKPGLKAELPLFPYDAASCNARRIIVPEADASLLKSAVSPYRMLRTRILQRCRANGWTILGLTSPGPGEGKTVTSLNLAISIAWEGNNDVFLIDLDMRNPSVCPYLGVSPGTDLTDFFQGRAPVSEVLFSPGIEHLAVAGSTRPIANASELLAGNRLDELVTHIRSVASNPLILLDLPPAVNADDALVVAPRVDAITLVVSEGKTRRDGMDAALDLLSGFKMAGVVLNRSMESLSTEYYGSR